MDIHFYKFTITIGTDEFGKSVEEGIVYSTKGYADALGKAIMHFVSDEQMLLICMTLYRWLKNMRRDNKNAEYFIYT